ncbi:MAG: undecaprenyl-diphosphatase UppP [Chloroflexi bacterium]|nr:undecaprenyl-diphosphatase UppP [Chloroflexota bacterium]
MLTILRAIILGLIQGLTEYIPVSSSAHLVIVPWLFRWTDPALTSLTFDVALHLGTLLAVIWFFAADWVRLIRAGVASIAERKIGADPDRRMAWFLVIGCIPGAIAGVLGESEIEKLFHQPNTPIQPSAMIVMAVLIALLGAALFLAERLAQHQRDLKQLTLRDAVVIGLAQAAAIFPGVSRSGSTITAGLAVGLERPAAARFSFLLSAPIIAGAGAKSLLDVYQGVKAGAITQTELLLFPIGFIAASISGYLCIKLLLRFLQRNSTNVFVYYRWALAVLVIVVALTRG